MPKRVCNTPTGAHYWLLPAPRDGQRRVRGRCARCRWRKWFPVSLDQGSLSELERRWVAGARWARESLRRELGIPAAEEASEW